MAYNVEKLKELALEGILKDGLVWIEDVCAYMGISKTTFYKYELNEVHEIKNAQLMERRKVKMSAYKALQEQMNEDRNTTATLAVLKLAGNQDERDALNGKQTTTIINNTHSDLLDSLEK